MYHIPSTKHSYLIFSKLYKLFCHIFVQYQFSFHLCHKPLSNSFDIFTYIFLPQVIILIVPHSIKLKKLIQGKRCHFILRDNSQFGTIMWLSRYPISLCDVETVKQFYASEVLAHKHQSSITFTCIFLSLIFFPAILKPSSCS